MDNISFLNYKLEKEHFICGDHFYHFIKSLKRDDVKYIKTDFIKKRKGFIINQKWKGVNETIDLRKIKVLVTGHSDFGIDKTELPILNLPNLEHWFCTNKHVQHPKLNSLPIGITDFSGPSRIHKIIGNTDVLLNIAKEKKKNINLALLNINVKTYKKERAIVMANYKDQKWTTMRGMNKSSNGHKQFIKDINNHNFVFAPRGNGVDTHRMWETMYMRSIPIVKKCIGMEDFYNLPVMWVNKWDDLTEEKLKKTYEEIKNKKYNMNMITMQYWKDLIISKIN